MSLAKGPYRRVTHSVSDNFISYLFYSVPFGVRSPPAKLCLRHLKKSWKLKCVIAHKILGCFYKRVCAECALVKRRAYLHLSNIGLNYEPGNRSLTGVLRILCQTLSFRIFSQTQFLPGLTPPPPKTVSSPFKKNLENQSASSPTKYSAAFKSVSAPSAPWPKGGLTYLFQIE